MKTLKTTVYLSEDMRWKVRLYCAVHGAKLQDLVTELLWEKFENDNEFMHHYTGKVVKLPKPKPKPIKRDGFKYTL